MHKVSLLLFYIWFDITFNCKQLEDIFFFLISEGYLPNDCMSQSDAESRKTVSDQQRGTINTLPAAVPKGKRDHLGAVGG